MVDAIPGDLSLALESFVTVADKQQPEAVAVPDNAREGVDRDAGRLGRRDVPTEMKVLAEPLRGRTGGSAAFGTTRSFEAGRRRRRWRNAAIALDGATVMLVRRATRASAASTALALGEVGRAPRGPCPTQSRAASSGTP